MAYVTDARIGGARFMSRTAPAKRARSEGFGMSAGAAIAGASVATFVFLAWAFAMLHGASRPDAPSLHSIALVNPQDAKRFQQMAAARDIRSDKAARLNPLVDQIALRNRKTGALSSRDDLATADVALLRDEKLATTRNALFAQTSKLTAMAVARAELEKQQQKQIAVAEAAKIVSQPQQPDVEVASLDTDQTEERFNLVMPVPQIEPPLPMARPQGWPKPAPPPAAAKANPPKQVLAYANPKTDSEEIGLPPKAVAPKMQAGVAIYDISAQRVYLPDGTSMEAHSGQGQYRDNPKYISMRGKGPTPPNTYKLTMREALFHGVPALRMTPSDQSKMYGRNGILAHTYLRRVPGDSAGCIVFKDYYKFLKYYKRGEIHTVVVVPSLKQAPAKKSTLASLFGG